MTIDQIIRLLEAGYTKEEITKLDSPATHTVPPAPEDKDPVPEPKEKDPDPEPEAPAKPAAPAAPAATEQDTIREALNNMTKTLSALSIRSSNIPGGDTKPETGESILADIINPRTGEIINKEK